MSKPSIPKGTRDFLPQVMVKRNYIFNTIKKSFVKYGFLPIETPCMENTATLMGKYGRPVLNESDLNLKLINFKSPEEGDLTEFMNHLKKCYQSDCRSLLDQDTDTDLINIVDEILALVNKTKYLISLK